VKYLRTFLDGPAHENKERGPDRTDTSPSVSFGSTPLDGSQGGPAVVPAFEGRTPPCAGCGHTDWHVSLVKDDGARYCYRCVSGDHRQDDRR
jgi:hypothetical protein